MALQCSLGACGKVSGSKGHWDYTSCLLVIIILRTKTSITTTTRTNASTGNTNIWADSRYTTRKHNLLIFFSSTSKTTLVILFGLLSGPTRQGCSSWLYASTFFRENKEKHFFWENNVQRMPRLDRHSHRVSWPTVRSSLTSKSPTDSQRVSNCQERFL